MAEVKLTQAQQAVVENRGGALLVSAAAGSGKTKVLVDRLLSYVEDPIAPANIDDFLIITYTKAAASELRGKISAEISKRLASKPENRHLQRQLTRIHLAQISTVHAFCAMLLRRYCTLRDLPPDFRVAEQTEADAIRLETSPPWRTSLALGATTGGSSIVAFPATMRCAAAAIWAAG